MAVQGFWEQAAIFLRVCRVIIKAELSGIGEGRSARCRMRDETGLMGTKWTNYDGPHSMWWGQMLVSTHWQFNFPAMSLGSLWANYEWKVINCPYQKRLKYHFLALLMSKYCKEQHVGPLLEPNNTWVNLNINENPYIFVTYSMYETDLPADICLAKIVILSSKSIIMPTNYFPQQ